jgi:hypothetical protein
MEDFFELIAERKIPEELMKTPQYNDMNELIPTNPNMVRAKRIKKEKKIKVKAPISNKPKAYTYDGEVSPFKDTLHFMNYYRAFLSNFVNGKVEFDQYASDSIFAAIILDTLIENKRNNKIFLNAWLRYFCDFSLKGQKALKFKYTSMKAFKETFDKFNDQYLEI